MVDLKGKIGKTYLEFTELHFDVTHKLLDEPLLIYFRSTNFTHDNSGQETPQCQLLYIEIEFRSDKNMHHCNTDYPQATPKNEAIHISEDYVSPGNDQIHTLIHTDNAEDQPFFFTQDYYITLDEANQEYDIQISLAQKFIDKASIIPVLEILEQNVDIDDVDMS